MSALSLCIQHFTGNNIHLRFSIFSYLFSLARYFIMMIKLFYFTCYLFFFTNIRIREGERERKGRLICFLPVHTPYFSATCNHFHKSVCISHISLHMDVLECISVENVMNGEKKQVDSFQAHSSFLVYYVDYPIYFH